MEYNTAVNNNNDLLLGESPQIKKIHRLIDLIAKTKSTVLIQGESGTGKEVVANAIHHKSLRANKPFIKVNCAALSESLLESELFGHKKGSYTGAFEDRRGFFEQANQGTILLDEIGSMPLSGQAKLLRVLQEDEVTPVGGSKVVKVNVRVIATTNVMLKVATKNGQVREDLYYRLSVITICLPPLKDRREDIPLLVNHFINLYNETNHKSVCGVTDKAMDVLMRYHWPGNVREIKNVMESVVVMSQNADYIDVGDLPEYLKEEQEEGVIQPINTDDYNLRNQLLGYEKSLIVNALNKTNWVKSRTAELLGIDRRNLGYFIKKHNILMHDKSDKATIESY
ncbi:MAG: sigma-54 interaction domain-containing protein [bacterium]